MRLPYRESSDFSTKAFNEIRLAHIAVVLAADGLSITSVAAANTDDIDGGAIQPNRNIEVGKNDAQ